MLKLTFEGNNVTDLHESINTYLADAAAGGTPAGAATIGSAAKPKKDPVVKKKETTLEEVSAEFVKRSDLTRDQKVALLLEFNAGKVGELEPKEYDDFLAKLKEL